MIFVFSIFFSVKNDERKSEIECMYVRACEWEIDKIKKYENDKKYKNRYEKLFNLELVGDTSENNSSAIY